MKAIYQHAGQATIWLTAIVMMLSLSALAQGSRVIAPDNRFRATMMSTWPVSRRPGRTPVADLLEDAEVDAYVERVGRRLVALIPREFLHLEFNSRSQIYPSTVVATRLPKKLFSSTDD